MAWSAGTFSRALGASQWANDAAANVGIQAGIHDTQDNDLATGINTCLTKDGQNTPTANLSMGGFKHTNVGNGTTSSDSVNYGQLLAIIPTGFIFPNGSSSVPTGYLLCDGSAVSRSTYSALFTAIATNYGVGDGTTTFNLPDLRGRFPLGKATAGTGSTLGGTGGSLDHTHTGPSHTHTVASHTHTGPSHTHPLGVAGQAQIEPTGSTLKAARVTNSFLNQVTSTVAFSADTSGATLSVPLQGNTDAGGTAATGGTALTTDAGGTGATGSANPAYQTVNYVIKT